MNQQRHRSDQAADQDELRQDDDVFERVRPTPGKVAATARLFRDAAGEARPGDLKSVLWAAARSSGTALPVGLLDQLERALGADLSRVRLHTGAEAQQAAAAVNARAFAYGQDIYFGAGSFDPSSTEGRRLIAHEVAHTVQAPAAGAIESAEISTPGDAAETEAHAFADAFATSGPAQWTQLRDAARPRPGGRALADIERAYQASTPRASRQLHGVTASVVGRPAIHRDPLPTPQGGPPEAAPCGEMSVEEMATNIRQRLSTVRNCGGPQAVVAEVRCLRASATGVSAQALTRALDVLTDAERDELNGTCSAPSTPAAGGTTAPNAAAPAAGAPAAAPAAGAPAAAPAAGAPAAAPAAGAPAAAPAAGAPAAGAPAAGAPAAAPAAGAPGAAPAAGAPGAAPAAGAPGAAPAAGAPGAAPAGAPAAAPAAGAPGAAPPAGAPAAGAGAPIPAQPARDAGGEELISQELAFHESWQAMSGGGGARAMRLFLSGETLMDLGQGARGAALQTAAGVGIQALAKRIPVPGVGNIIGGVFSGIALYQGGIKGVTDTFTNFGKLGDSFRNSVWLGLADLFSCIIGVLNLVGNVANVLSGLCYGFAAIAALSGILAIIFPPIAPIAAWLMSMIPGAINFGRAAGAVGTIAMSISNALSILPPVFRAIHIITSKDDPIRLAAQEQRYHGEIQGAIANYGNAAAERGMSTGGRSFNPMAQWGGSIQGAGRTLRDSVTGGRAQVAEGLDLRAREGQGSMRERLGQARQALRDPVGVNAATNRAAGSEAVADQHQEMAGQANGRRTAADAEAAGPRADAEAAQARTRTAETDVETARTREIEATQRQATATEREVAAGTQQREAARIEAEARVTEADAARARGAAGDEQTRADQAVADARARETELAARQENIEQQRAAMRETQEQLRNRQNGSNAQRELRNQQRGQRESIENAQRNAQHVEAEATAARARADAAEASSRAAETRATTAEATAATARSNAETSRTAAAEAQTQAQTARTAATTAANEAAANPSPEAQARLETARAQQTEANRVATEAQGRATEAARQSDIHNAAARSSRAEANRDAANADAGRGMQGGRVDPATGRYGDSGPGGEVGNTTEGLYQTARGAVNEGRGDAANAAMQENRGAEPPPIEIHRNEQGHVQLPDPRPPGVTVASIHQQDERIEELREQVQRQRGLTASARQVATEASARGASLTTLATNITTANTTHTAEHNAGRAEVASQDAQVNSQAATANGTGGSNLGQAGSALGALMTGAQLVASILNRLPDNRWVPVASGRNSVNQFIHNLEEMTGAGPNHAQRQGEGNTAVAARGAAANAASTTNATSSAAATGLHQRVNSDATAATTTASEATSTAGESTAHEQSLEGQLTREVSTRNTNWSGITDWATEHRAIRMAVQEITPGADGAGADAYSGNRLP